jgi:hypothetical protein
MFKKQIINTVETIEPILEKFKTVLTEILIGNYELEYCKSVEMQKFEEKKSLSRLESRTEI